MSSYDRNPNSQQFEICITNVAYRTEPHELLTYFEQFGSIDRYSFTSPDGGGIVFISYIDQKSVDCCMANRPHRLDGQNIYVKRVVPATAELPREHIDSSRDLMIVIDCNDRDEQFLKDIRAYFSSYGILYACKYCHEANFDYVLIEFADYDQVDRIILDQPHFLNSRQLNVMKYTSTNIVLHNVKYSPKDSPLFTQDSVDIDDDERFLRLEYNLKNNCVQQRTKLLNEIDMDHEIQRLRNVLKQLNDEFTIKRQQLEDDCCAQLRKLNENANRAHQLQHDLEQEYAKLLLEYESLRSENQLLNEQYITAELENFEITSYYEQILAEEKAKTANYEAEYTEKLHSMHGNSRATSSSRTSTPISLPAIPDDEEINNIDNEGK